MQIFLAAALAGLMATPHCAAMCGGFAGACARPRAGLWAWHTGRLTTYAVLGLIAGLVGDVLPGPAWLPAMLAAVLLVWFAASLAGLTPAPAARVPGLARAGQLLARRDSTLMRYLFGTITGLLPCGMVYAALSIALAAAQPLYGAAAMVVFGLGTAPGLSVLSFGLRRLALRGIWTRRALAALILACGLWSIGVRGFGAWAAAITPDDHDRLRRLPQAWTTARAQARNGGYGPELAALGALADADAALPDPAPPPGRYRCRTIKIGAQGGLLDYVAYSWFACEIAADAGGTLRLDKLSGSQRQHGTLYPDTDRRLVFLGALALGSGETTAPAYGTDPERNVVGVMERIAPARWRLVQPWPRFETNLDLLEMEPTPG